MADAVNKPAEPVVVQQAAGEQEPQQDREISQTDHLNKKLLVSLLNSSRADDVIAKFAAFAGDGDSDDEGQEWQA